MKFSIPQMALASSQFHPVRFILESYQQKFNRCGERYLDMQIIIQGQPLRLFLWQKNNQTVTDILVENAEYQADIRIWRYCGNYYAQTNDLVPINHDGGCFISGANDENALEAQLRELIEQITIPVLRQCMINIFTPNARREAFLRLPASREHHHSYPGGLAEHSIEVANIILDMTKHQPEWERQLGMAAGLLHDLGKIRTHRSNGSFSQLGALLRHESLTLELIGPELQQLEQVWPDGANALRYLLSYQNIAKERFRPKMPVALTLGMADQLSAAKSAQQIAFAQQPDWKRFANLKTEYGPPSNFWQPKLPPQLKQLSS